MPVRLSVGAAGVIAMAVAAVAVPPARAAIPPDHRTAAIEVLVHGVDTDAALSAVAQAGLTTVEVWDRIGVVRAMGSSSAIATLAYLEGVTRIEHDRPIELFLDTAHVATRATDARSPASGVVRKDGSPYDGSGVTIAVVDTGADGTHEFFQRPNGTTKVVANLRQLCADEWPCSAWLELPDTDTVAAGGHGTHVAGIAAGTSRHTFDGLGLRGVAPGADLVVLSVGLGRSLIATDSALNWVLEHHADPCGDGSCPPIKVVNNSWGSSGAFDPNDAVSKLQNALVAEGVTVVFAAGNSGGDGSADRVNPYAKNPTPGVLSVANYDDGESGLRDHRLSNSSSRGLIGDPATYPDLAAPGTAIRSSCRAWLLTCASTAVDPNYRRLSGTSMAAPYIAGVVALLVEANPSLTPAHIEDILEDSAHKFGTGYEFDPTNPNSLTSFDKGHGLVDVVTALQLALQVVLKP